VLDVLGKWSLLDIYVSIMLVVGMHFHVPLDTPDRASPTIVNMWVTPEPALFVYWGVIILSLVMTHVMLHTHRACVEANLGAVPEAQHREALCNHVFKSGQLYFRFTGAGKALVALIILVTAGAVVLGRSYTCRGCGPCQFWPSLSFFTWFTRLSHERLHVSHERLDCLALHPRWLSRRPDLFIVEHVY
jgi:hypothetical protein